MRNKLILLLFTILAPLFILAQTITEIDSGEWYIMTLGSRDLVLKADRPLTAGGPSAPLTADTVFYVPSTAPNDTIATLMAARPVGKRAAILQQRGSVRRTTITVSQDSLIFGSYGTGANPVIEGADAITGITPLYNGSNVWSETMTTNASNTTLYNFRQGIPALSASGTKIRVLFVGSTGTSTKISGASIGKRRSTSGDDFVETPIRLTFGGQNNYDIPQSGSVYSDWVDYNAQKDSLYFVHAYMSTPTGFRYSVTTAPPLYRSTSSTDNTLTQTINYGANLGFVNIVSAVQVGTPVVNMYAKINVTTQPFITWYNDTIAPLAADTASLDVDGEWFWNTGDKTFYLYATSNPAGKVELGQRGILIDASSRSNITVSNLTLQHSNNNNTIGFGSTRGALYMNGGSYLTVTRCTIQDNSLHGIHVINSSYITINSNTLLRNGTMNWNGRNAEIRTLSGWNQIGRYYTFTNNISSYAGADGFMILASTYDYMVKHITISGNTFNNNAASGCYPINSDSTAIFNNTFANNGDGTKTGEDYAIGVQSGSNIDIYNNTITNQGYNDAIQVWADATVPSHNARIFRNYISGTTDGNCIELIPTGNQSMLNPEIFSNVIANSNSIALYIGKTGAGTADTVKVYNNTFYGNGESDIFMSGSSASSMPFTLKNNIFSSAVSTGVYAFTGSVITATSNNLWYKASGNVLNNLGTTYTTATITNFEASAQNTDPLFVNAAAGNFQLQTGSPAINNGVNVGLTTDILGNPVPSGGGYDIGAYERQP